MLEKKHPELAVVLAFDVKVTAEAEEEAAKVKYDCEFLSTLVLKYDCKFLSSSVPKYNCKFLSTSVLRYDCKFLSTPVLKYDCKFQLGVKIMKADIIYHLFDEFKLYMANVKAENQKKVAEEAVFPVVLRIPDNKSVFNKKDPIVCGVDVVEGVLKIGTPLCVADKDFLELGRVASIEKDKKAVKLAHKGDTVAIKVQPFTADQTHVLYGRHFDHSNLLYSKISRQSIDCLKEYFRAEMRNEDWELVLKLKSVFKIH